ncbi:epimerase [Patiriisocius marinistellae]|uniref:Epimerase n=1 Tax=Patiriisocius marinistellae TaxID=2494560 RepID=A0A5J4FXG8_9FLAO|nr:NAD(P)-binding domain-containing protein [Patiriisocius marinistellae]GEQ84745.1 epimerase [Patiriisocius marinistellae]
MSKTIAIAGLGWLGKPLAQHLMILGYKVKGSVTSQKKAGGLQNNGIDAYAVNITEEGVLGSPQGFLKNTDVLIIMIPPGLRRNSGADYVLKMSHFLAEIKQSKIEKVVFISSTSVYGDEQGVVTEKDIPEPNTEAGRQLFKVEQLFFNTPDFKTSILRFGGLMGGTRQPVKYLAGRKDLNGGNDAVNLIHRNDCIKILLRIINKDSFGTIFNGVHPEHPLKKDFYYSEALKLGLEPPQFSNEEISEGKQVDSLNLKLVLGFEFKNPLNQ